MTADNLCRCPTDFTEYEGSCIECVIDFCNLCTEQNYCMQCLGDLIVLNNNSLCGCPQTYEQWNDTCVCPGNTTEYNDTCYQCEVNWCDVCSEDNVCHECAETFELTEDYTCMCPENTTKYDGRCYECNIPYCD